MLLLGVGADKASELHRKLVSHHDESAVGIEALTEMVIDWEAARFTKPDKPLNARETMEKFYPSMTGRISPILDRIHL